MSSKRSEIIINNRRAKCAVCGLRGVHVDTTAGEIVANDGEVVAIVSGEIPLMVTERGRLTCPRGECNRLDRVTITEESTDG